MEHQPDPVLGIQAQLQEVVAPAQRPELVARLGLQVPHCRGQVLEIAPQCRVSLHRPLVLLEPDRDRALDFAAQTRQRVRQVARSQAAAHGGETAADVDADRRRREGPLHRDHGADGGSLAVVHVRHRGDVVEHPGQLRDVA